MKINSIKDLIDALEQLFKKSNEEIQDYFGDVE